ncbi:MAG: hypothetical protein ACU836_17390 [Gammaproteobacteria bacterium]
MSGRQCRSCGRWHLPAITRCVNGKRRLSMHRGRKIASASLDVARTRLARSGGCGDRKIGHAYCRIGWYHSAT